MTELTVGMFGLGSIGSRLAVRLAESFPVVGYDPHRGDSDELAGVERVTSPEQVSTRADVICLSLPSAAISIDVVRDIASAQDRRARVVIEHSTIGPEAAQASATIARETGLGYVDAPVSGGIRRAVKGDLSVMAAGKDADLEVAMPVLNTVGSRVTVMGDAPGLGQAMKLANNIISLTSLAVTSEAIVFGARFGLDMQKMIDAINASSGRSVVSEVKFPISIIPRKYQHGAHGEIALKDVSLYVESARQAGVPVYIPSATEALWSSFIHAHPDTDYSYIHKYLEDML